MVHTIHHERYIIYHFTAMAGAVPVAAISRAAGTVFVAEGQNTLHKA
jgi:hypothetical protein